MHQCQMTKEFCLGQAVYQTTARADVAALVMQEGAVGYLSPYHQSAFNANKLKTDQGSGYTVAHVPLNATVLMHSILASSNLAHSCQHLLVATRCRRCD